MDIVKRIVVASNNPVKLDAVRRGFQRMFPEETFTVQPISAPSGVSDQPASDAETLQGAVNRASAARQMQPRADYWVGLEGGITDQTEEMEAYAWIVVLSHNQMGKSRTTNLFLPLAVAELVRQGKELGEADDIVFGRLNSKQDNGAVGILTGNVVTRSQSYEMAGDPGTYPVQDPILYPIK